MSVVPDCDKKLCAAGEYRRADHGIGFYDAQCMAPLPPASFPQTRVAISDHKYCDASATTVLECLARERDIDDAVYQLYCHTGPSQGGGDYGTTLKVHVADYFHMEFAMYPDRCNVTIDYNSDDHEWFPQNELAGTFTPAEPSLYESLCARILKEEFGEIIKKNPEVLTFTLVRQFTAEGGYIRLDPDAPDAQHVKQIYEDLLRRRRNMTAKMRRAIATTFDIEENFVYSYVALPLS